MLHFATQPPKTVYYTVFEDCPVGPVLMGLTEKNELCRLSFMRKRTAKTIIKEWKARWMRTTFLKGDDKAIAGPESILLVGTAFQQKVWKELPKIPVGTTISYGEMAKRIGKPKATRAVGSALGQNPVPWLIPCHRVITTDGKLGGYGAPLPIKKKLLKLEDAI